MRLNYDTALFRRGDHVLTPCIQSSFRHSSFRRFERQRLPAMKRVLYLVRRRPSVVADETTDLALVSGVFEQPTTMLFMDDGVFQLVGLEDRQSSLKALPTYGIEDIRVCGQSLSERNLEVAAIGLPVQVANEEAIRELLAAADVVVSD